MGKGSLIDVINLSIGLIVCVFMYLLWTGVIPSQNVAFFFQPHSTQADQYKLTSSDGSYDGKAQHMGKNHSRNSERSGSEMGNDTISNSGVIQTLGASADVILKNIDKCANQISDETNKLYSNSSRFLQDIMSRYVFVTSSLQNAQRNK